MRQELVRNNKDVWKARFGEKVSDERMRQMIKNISGYFDKLYEWSQKNQNPEKEHQGQWPPMVR